MPEKSTVLPLSLALLQFARFGLEQPRRRAADAPARQEGFGWTTRPRPTAASTPEGASVAPRWGRRTPYGLRRDSRGDGWHEPADGRSDATYAALDLGTNNCRLLIARPAGDGFRVVDAFSRIIRLGEGVAASRRISEAAIARAVEALQVCRDKMHARGVVRARLIATEACRAAENGEAFRNRVAEQAGLELEIIDSATEARLAATGCTELFDPAASGVILFDIGGGSSELVRLGRPGAGRRGPPKPDIVGWASLPVGVVTLAERYGGHVVSRGDLRGHGGRGRGLRRKIRRRPSASISAAFTCSAPRAR